ncbi:MAG: glycosyltransferase family 9 protein, partial [Waddliaceae bacterium]|nr:glycosyltransferase family 9 protein [Waddliaceae bacterium]
MGYSNIKNIVVRMPNWLGDIIMATPVLEDLRERFPEANIVAMCQSNGAAILEGNPFIDEIFAYQRPKTNSEKTAIIEKIRDGNYDLGVLTTNSFSSAWWFLRGKVKQRIGYTGNLRGFLLTTAIPFPKERECQHLVDTYKNILTPLGTKISKSTTQCYVSDEERRHANITLEDLGVPTDATIIGINASAAFGTAKCWLPERFAGLTQRLLEDINVHVLYFGDASGTSLIEGICSNFTERVYSMAGKTSLRSFISLVAACNVFITNDSGPMHIA